MAMVKLSDIGKMKIEDSNPKYNEKDFWKVATGKNNLQEIPYATLMGGYIRSTIRGNESRLPRNVQGYHIQDIPDGCHNCENKYLGMFRLDGTPILACKKACHNPESPSYCDEVGIIGKCDSYEKEKEKVKEAAV